MRHEAKQGRAARLRIKVLPSSSRDRIVGWYDDALKISVSAPPEKGKANTAAREIIARVLNLPIADIVLIAGKSSRCKCLQIDGIDENALRNAIQRVLDQSP